MIMDKCFNPVVMACGVGNRLWPLSRASFPKHYDIPNCSKRSLGCLK